MLPDVLKRLNSVAFRGAVWVTLIALLTTGMALTLQYLQTVRTLETRTEALLNDEMISLVERHQTGGLMELVTFLRRQQQLPRFHEYFYVLADPRGDVIIGNAPTWPPEVVETGHKSIRVPVLGASGELQLRWVDTATAVLPDSHQLLVGRLAEDRAQIRERYLRAIFWSFLVTGLAGLLLGWWFSRRGVAFVDRVSRSGARILEGDLDVRIPVSSRGDEYDRLAATMNACFEEIGHVVHSLRATTDGVAHDLKTPLTRIKARLELLEMRDVGKAELLAGIETTRENLDNLLQIINDVLSVAKVEATTPLSFTPLNLRDVVLEVLELYQPVAEDRQVRFDARLEDATVNGARSLLGQLVANLVDNAIKYSALGSVVTVTVRSHAGGTELRISDRGPGIPPHKHQDAMERFVRLDPSRSSEGVGLGLSIVKAIARVHRAELRLDDNAPGLLVEIRFPPAPAREEEFM
ncbi:MAG TPA: HAMP domain-containing sensor histidine kinase [Allosphingosinicella sp.]|nr:HAMP domain-containing sensor histidine kinase [Allosphingosinicella sp.]